MLICESSLEAAVKACLRDAEIPVEDELYRKWGLRCKFAPAFLKALSKIEEVELCYGFDINNIDWGPERS